VDHVHASELLGAFVLDACDEFESEQLRAHIEVCIECGEQVDRLNAVAGLIGAGSLEAPPPELRSRVLDASRDIP
jgi:hypothetical protein